MTSGDIKPPEKGNIQIIHMSGNRQGEIAHFSSNSITFGRSQECDVVLPRDALTVSRIHAKIDYADGQCRFLNLSVNGSYINGELRDETPLLPGDVITFSLDGPKVSILYERRQDLKSPPKPRKTAAVPGQISRVSGLYGNKVQQVDDENAGEFIVFFGGKLKAFYQKNISIGRNHRCDFPIEHTSILDQHIVLYYENDHYFLHNATELKLTCLNGDMVHDDVILKVNDCIDFNKYGPSLIYKGQGKFQEKSSHQDSANNPPSTVQTKNHPRQRNNRSGWLQRIFSRWFDRHQERVD